MKNLVLGTVQLGINYGINNRKGRPLEQECFDILDYAFANNIQYLDTAADYGDAEKVIGSFVQKKQKQFNICTKLTSKFEMDNEDIKQNLIMEVNKSLARLNTESIYLYYLHSFKHCKNEKIMDTIAYLKQNKIIKSIGVSIYEPNELRYIIDNISDSVDIVQIPFNILDSYRWLEDDLLNIAQSKKIKIFTRSTYLQGLIFKPQTDAFIKKLEAESYIEFLNKLAQNKACTVSKIAFDFCKSIKAIDSIIVGCEAVEQLEESVALFNSVNVLNQEDIDNMISFCKNINNSIIDPRVWGGIK